MEIGDAVIDSTPLLIEKWVVSERVIADAAESRRDIGLSSPLATSV